MLSSSQLASISRASVRGSLAPTTILLQSAGRVSRRTRSYQQVRAFRIGFWSSYLDPTFQAELRRRHRSVVKHKVMKALHRDLSWDRHFPAQPRQFGLKGFMCSAWRGHDTRPGGRWINMDKLKTPREKQQDEMEMEHQEIEDMREQNHQRLLKIRHDLFNRFRAKRHRVNEEWSSFTLWTPSPDSTIPSEASQKSTASPKKSQWGVGNNDSFNPSFHPSFNPEAEYEIDPITNRKVYKNTTGQGADSIRKPIDIPVKTFKGYRSQFQGFAPPESKSGHGAKSSRSRETNSESVDSVQEGLKAYDVKADYETGRGYDPAKMDIDYSDPDQAACKAYDDKISTKGLESKSPIIESSEAVDPVEEGLKTYDEKVDYSTGALYDPAKMDIDYSDPDQAGCKAYDEKLSSLQTNDEVEVSEPMSIHKGPQLLETELNSTTETQGDSGSGKWDPIQKAIQDYEVAVNGPGKTAQDPAELDEQIFKPMRDLEAKTLRERAEKREESVGAEHEQKHPLLKSLREYETTGSREQAMENEQSNQDKMQEGLKEYDEKVDYNSGALYDPATMDIDYSDPDQAACKAYDEKISSLGSSEEVPNSKEYMVAETETAEDLEHLRASDIRAASGIIRNLGTETYPLKMEGKELDVDIAEIGGNILSSSDEPAKSEKAHESRKLAENLRIENSELQNHVAHARGRVNAKIAEVEAGWPNEPKSQKLTGNFVRDFPEEFESSWSVKDSTSESLTPRSRSELETEAEIQQEESAYINGLAPTESFARSPDTPRIETSMDRSSSGSYKNIKANKKKDRELVKEVRGIYEDAYGTIDVKHRQIPEIADASSSIAASDIQATPAETSTEGSEPTLYKILAYDPTMQSISIAETTSIVTDASSPLTPAEVLLRLSNPSKFFPHFGPLQSQGYEIVSGSGDVLVFRKVRSGSPLGVNAKSSSYSGAQDSRGINPIDGMRSPMAATGNFASPTGFVNHDSLLDYDPPFKSNIDVRREEPVFSGKQNWTENEEPRPKSRGKKVLIGAAWLGACSYAIGVVTEFFKTGGADGKGPQGF